MSFIQSIAKARYLTLGLGVLATAAPVFAQIPAAPLLGQTPPAPAPAPATPSAAPAPAPVIDAQAKALLDQSLARYRALKSLSVSYERSGRTQLIQFSAPASLKVTSLESTGNVALQQFYTDSDIITMQKPNDAYEWVSSPRPAAPEGQEARARVARTTVGGGFFPSFLAGLDPFRADSAYQISSLALGSPTTNDGVAVTPIVASIPKSARLPYEMTVTIALGKKDHLVHNINTEVKLPDGRTVTTVESFKDIKANAKLSTAEFTFTPPAGATKVERFSPPQVRAIVGQVPLAINSKDIDGKPISFDQYKGKVTLVDFWATWCGPCKAELPNVVANYNKYHDQGFDVVGISLDQTTDPLPKFIKDNNMPWRQVFDGYWDGPIATSFNVRAIPATILIGKDGKIAAIGARGDKLEPAIQAALAAQ